MINYNLSKFIIPVFFEDLLTEIEYLEDLRCSRNTIEGILNV